jgi:hypothetical protein
MPYPSPSGPNLIEDDSVVAGLLSPVPVRNVLPRLRRVARTLLRRSICVDRRREVDHHIGAVVNRVTSVNSITWM